MKDIRGRVAFVSGGASGIGLGIVRAFVNSGMRVAVADIRAESLERALGELGSGAQVHPMQSVIRERRDALLDSLPAEPVNVARLQMDMMLREIMKHGLRRD
jgi:NAD(P)-dependent dehydrogenase (short-subunit alcohol dehydrogenase family)